MADQRNGGIAWTEETWNPLRGCSRVSEGCRNCYAESMAARFCGAGMPYEGTINPETKRWNGKIKLVPERLADPLRWQRPRMVFVNSMSDLFHESVPDDFIDKVFAVMALAPQHTFQVLTKRPERMLEYFKSFHGVGAEERGWNVCAWAAEQLGMGGHEMQIAQTPKGLPNVWLGVTVENQEAADERIPLLLQTPAAVRWVSMEPLLGSVDLALLGTLPRSQHANYTQVHSLLHWVVVGGESGPHARPMHPDWAGSLRDQCAAAGVPFLFKQWGEWVPADQCAATTGDALYTAHGDDLAYQHLAVGHEGIANPDAAMAGDEPQAVLYRAGKKAAGRLLDGKLHDGYPEVKP